MLTVTGESGKRLVMDSRHYNPKRLVELREEKGLTQETVAAQLNVQRETISRVERGKVASYDILCDYTGLLGVNVTDILHPRPLALSA
jgi:transcriptional regulator with XRE-family HTH domain